MAMSFNDAARALFGAPENATVTSKFRESKEYQIGDYTWDTDPGGIDLLVSWYVADRGFMNRSKTFESLPDLFDALRRAEEDADKNRRR